LDYRHFDLCHRHGWSFPAVNQSGPWSNFKNLPERVQIRSLMIFTPWPVTSSSVAGLFTLSSVHVGQGHFSWLSSACGYLACGDLAYGLGVGKRRIYLPWTLLNDTWVSRLTMAMVQWKFCSFWYWAFLRGSRCACPRQIKSFWQKRSLANPLERKRGSQCHLIVRSEHIKKT
jgi:hypothetical protein